MNDSRKTRKTRVGVVVSNRMQKSVVVQIERLVRHKLYGKFVRSRAKYVAHDEENTSNIGDRVLIEECRPLSKRKRWRIREVVERVA